MAHHARADGPRGPTAGLSLATRELKFPANIGETPEVRAAVEGIERLRREHEHAIAHALEADVELARSEARAADELAAGADSAAALDGDLRAARQRVEEARGNAAILERGVQSATKRLREAQATARERLRAEIWPRYREAAQAFALALEQAAAAEDRVAELWEAGERLLAGAGRFPPPALGLRARLDAWRQGMRREGVL